MYMNMTATVNCSRTNATYRCSRSPSAIVKQHTFQDIIIITIGEYQVRILCPR
jgi:hypothetical protein